MNILLITPGLNKNFNDNYHAYKSIANEDNNILVISNKENINKGGRLIKDIEIEIDGKLVINRIFDTKKKQQSLLHRFIKRKKINKILEKFSPDIVFCEEISNFKFALEIKKKYKIPAILRTEFAYNESHPYRSMGRVLRFFKNPITGDKLAILLGKTIWNWAYRNSDAIISCYFEDSHREPLIQNTPFYYIPWPCYLPKISNEGKQFKERAVFIGAFDPHKNLNELSITIPKILELTPITKFSIVGSGEGIDIIEKLKNTYPNSVEHVESMSREDCLKLIKESYFSYSPAIRGGWGFIGDSWAMKTPVIVTNNHYGFKDGIDSIVTSPEEIIDRINSLYENSSKYEFLSNGGYKRFFENHTAEAVGASFLQVCISSVQSQK